MSTLHREISDRAYFIWKNTGCQDAKANWFQALDEIVTLKNFRRQNATTRRLSNPGIGDSSFIYRDKNLRAGLSQFKPDSYELKEISPSHVPICGGYEYALLIMDQHDSINAFVDQWEKCRSSGNVYYNSDDDADAPETF